MIKRQFKHLFLCPFREYDSISIGTILSLVKNQTNQFHYLISFSSSEAYNEAVNKKIASEEISIILNAACKERSEHWTKVAHDAYAMFSFDHFSYFFCGDTLFPDDYPANLENHDNKIYLCRYYINQKTSIKKQIFDGLISNPRLIDKLNFLAGKPPYGPLQKIIFPRRIAPSVYFDGRYPFTCDQMMITNLIQNGVKHCYINEAFYLLNMKSRKFYNNIKTVNVLHDQFFLYLKNRCFFGIPFIFLRTLIKRLMRSK